jgi:hypothetical protein
VSLPPVILRDLAQERLQAIFPPAAFDPALSNPLAGAAVAAMLYVGTVIDDDAAATKDHRLARPSTCLWIQPEVFTRVSGADREKWFRAAMRGKKQTAELVRSWGFAFEQWYADTTREPLRDETLREWAARGAVRRRKDLPTSSPSPLWALTESFAALFDPDLTSDALAEEIDKWRSTHLEPLDLLRIRTNVSDEAQQHAVKVTLPDGAVRYLEAGRASLILKGIVEQWAPKRLEKPVVLTISEPGDKVYVADSATLDLIGVKIDSKTLLPDALIVDVGERPVVVWVVEAVATDGPITEERKADLLQWASDQRIDPANVRFVTAFQSRMAPIARKRLKDIAVGTTAWFLDEPDRELTWREIRRV